MFTLLLDLTFYNYNIQSHIKPYSSSIPILFIIEETFLPYESRYFTEFLYFCNLLCDKH